MSTESMMHQRNLDSSILFMQQEHATVLKGLHDEIALLQKKCTDLTFQLTMHGLTIDEPGEVDNQVQKVQQELKSSRERIAVLEKELADKDKRIERLEADAKSQRKRWLEESRAQSQITNSLRAELEAKANNIAYLTTELHRLKQKNKQEQSANPSSQASVHANPGIQSQPGYLHPESALPNKRTQTQHHYIPAPPPRERTLGAGSVASRLRRSGHSKSVTNSASSKPLLAVHPASADALIGRPSGHTKVTSSGRSSGSESPDITPFIPPVKEDAVALEVKQAPMVLPPIPLNGVGAPINASGAQPVLVHQVVSSTSQHRQKLSPSNASASIVTLAVGNAAPDTAWSLAQEHRSSDYN